ncbi:Retrovirus-related Pol polyprotein from transposon RE2 [Vitis vinifera]|uniref:Retrovirus-related Pol polyprotein from transposon RE2 n=1 Tax=Vitis vinifera TaxID=29760 RepID=A0A438IMT4_VITVI|nr:Retrovirus-related Pol polyprotein from transposon RE2 [Vitis vinifera]
MMKTPSHDNSAQMVVVENNSNTIKGGEKDIRWRDYCKRPKHTRETCWKLHGRPQQGNKNVKLSKPDRSFQVEIVSDLTFVANGSVSADENLPFMKTTLGWLPTLKGKWARVDTVPTQGLLVILSLGALFGGLWPPVSILWNLIFSLSGVHWVLHSTVRGNLLGWNGAFVGKRRETAWRAAPLCLMWTLWKERNGRAFNDVKWAKQAIKFSLLMNNSYKTFTTNLNSSSVPKNIQEALVDPKWKEAIDEEMKALYKNDMWDIVDLPKGKHPIGCKWVFTIKYKADGSIERYKARLVSKGYTQTYRIDYQETFALVAKMNSIRILLSLAANSDCSQGLGLKDFLGPLWGLDISKAKVTMLIVYMDNIMVIGDDFEEIQNLKEGIHVPQRKYNLDLLLEETGTSGFFGGPFSSQSCCEKPEKGLEVIVYAALYLKLKRNPNSQERNPEKNAARILNILEPEKSGKITRESCIQFLSKWNEDVEDLIFMKPLHVRIGLESLSHPKAENAKETVLTETSIQVNVLL